MQHTLNDTVVFSGKGLHNGEPVIMVVRPAPIDHGIVFVRTDIENHNKINALWDNVEISQLCTLLKNENDVSVGTIEHLMASFAGMGIDNALVELNASEVPIMDGSAIMFVNEFEKMGLKHQDAPRRAIRILQTIEVSDDKGRVARFEPDVSSIYEYMIDFDVKTIGRQSYCFELMDASDFKDDISSCRTFTQLKEVEMLQQMGLIKGGGLDNAVVFDDDKILNPEGMRCSDEPVRHKILDAIGDIYLAGCPIIGRFVCERGGHALTNQLLYKLFESKSSYIETTDHLGIGKSENLSAYNA
jgi:UDP-3-O-[3-hydroxymyristoyl] N-acetylglucosamine deacetylase